MCPVACFTWQVSKSGLGLHADGNLHMTMQSSTFSTSKQQIPSAKYHPKPKQKGAHKSSIRIAAPKDMDNQCTIFFIKKTNVQYNNNAKIPSDIRKE